MAKRYVVHGTESGGAVRELGRYVTFAGVEGEPIAHLHPIDSLKANGAHAVVVAPMLVKVDMFRFGRTCQLLIVKHEPLVEAPGKRPELKNTVLFRGVDGYLGLERRARAGKRWERCFRSSIHVPVRKMMSRCSFGPWCRPRPWPSLASTAAIRTFCWGAQWVLPETRGCVGFFFEQDSLNRSEPYHLGIQRGTALQ